MPSINWPYFQELWNAADQQYSRLDAQTQVLVLYMCLFASRLSNHPLVMNGTGCPTLAQACDGGYSTSQLESWGRQRAPFCNALEEHANFLFLSVRGFFDLDGLETGLQAHLETPQRGVMLIPNSLSINIALMRLLVQHKGEG